MPRIAYRDRNFSAASLEKIAAANAICEQYANQGFTLTLRQLYYQFVSRDLIPNNQREYKNLGNVVNDARMAGYIDWYHLEDRTRNLRALSHWNGPADIVEGAAGGYRIDRWANQPSYVEVWIEKDALVGVIEGVCQRNDVPYFSCRGYTSQSEVWSAAQRLLLKSHGGDREVVIIHLGDHDPSGIDMTRDVQDRLTEFMEYHDADAAARVSRIALNWDQVEQYAPPPNPAKLTDSRADSYIRRYGLESWELDALEPTVIGRLIEEEIDRHRDHAIWEEDYAKQEQDRESLWGVARRFRAQEQAKSRGNVTAEE